jgi:Fur family peroxide stress response transcriptional regulator
MDTKLRLQELTTKLRQSGCRLTPQRMAVLKVLAHSQGHPSAEQIYTQVKAEFPMTSLGTVYKTIQVLKEMGQVLELGFPHQSNRYDGNMPYPHPHLICVQCEQIIDPDVSMLPDLAQVVARQTGFQIVTHRLDFYGICPACQQKSPS